MVPMIRNILGGFLFSGDDVYKQVRVLSGGERTRLAVARMLLRPSNTLLLDEPTNHLDLDSKEVLLDALVDYGGTLIFVSHDRYFVERLATKIIEIGNGTAIVYPGTYKEFLWHKEHADEAGGPSGRPERTASRSARAGRGSRRQRPKHAADSQRQPRAAKPRRAAEPPRAKKRNAPMPRRAKKSRAEQARRAEIDALEAQIAETENAIRDLEQRMAAPGFYDDRAAAQPVIDRAPGPDVEGRRPDAPVGRAPNRQPTSPRRPTA